jgi:predicted enzyme related to lactoylglutathione lyase
MPHDTTPLFRKIDCLRIRVDDLEAGLAFYRDGLGHALVWRSTTAAGLRMPETGAEIVIHTERPGLETDLFVDSVEDAVARFVAAGGTVAVPPFDIAIGRCAVVFDPWGNALTVLDMSKGPLRTDGEGNVIEP